MQNLVETRIKRGEHSNESNTTHSKTAQNALMVEY